MTSKISQTRADAHKSQSRCVLLVGDASNQKLMWLAHSLHNTGHGVHVLSFDACGQSKASDGPIITSFGLKRPPSLLHVWLFIICANVLAWARRAKVVHIFDDGKYGGMASLILHPRKILTVPKATWLGKNAMAQGTLARAFRRVKALSTDSLDVVTALGGVTSTPVFFTKMPFEPSPDVSLRTMFEKACLAKIVTVYGAATAAINFTHLVDLTPIALPPKKINIFYSCSPMPIKQNGQEGQGDVPSDTRTCGAIMRAMQQRDLVVAISGTAAQKATQLAKAKYWQWLGAEIGYCFAESGNYDSADTHNDKLEDLLPDVAFLKWIDQSRIIIGLYVHETVQMLSTNHLRGWPYQDRFLRILSKVTNRPLARFYDYNFDVLFASRTHANALQKTITQTPIVPISWAVDGWQGLKTELPNRRLRLVYVCRFGQTFDLRELCASVNLIAPLAELTILCENDAFLKKAKKQLEPYSNSPAVKFVVERTSGNYATQCNDYDIGVLTRHPDEYWPAELPNAVYHYVGWNLPVLAASGTRIGKAIIDQNLGWAVDHRVDSLVNILKLFISNRGLIKDKFEGIARFAKANKWDNRLDQIESSLGVLAPDTPELAKAESAAA